MMAISFTSLPVGCLAAFSVAGVLLTAMGCDEPGPIAPPYKAPFEEPEFICPLPERDRQAPPPATFVAERAGGLPQIGRACAIRSKSLHRLNRAEYHNAVRDVFGADINQPLRNAAGVALRPADAFPADHSEQGFDNIADILSLSPILVEKYFEAARLTADAVLNDGSPVPRTQTLEAEDYLGGNSEDGFARIQAGNRSLQFTVEDEGDYDLRVMAYGEQAGPDIVRMEVTIGYGSEVPTLGVFTVDATAENPQLYQGRLRLAAGQHVLVVRYLNEYMRVEDRGIDAVDRNLIVDFVEIEGPFNPAPSRPSASRQRVMTCDPDEAPSEDAPAIGILECGRQILAPIARRALRREVPPSELDRFLGFLSLAASDGQGFEVGLKLAFRALLLHPEFLFRLETDPDLTSADAHLLNDQELASRLSFFLWSSGPDDRLLDLAAAGQLGDPVVYDAEVERMLDDNKARALAQNFAGQWLSTRVTTEVQLDAELYPEWDRDLAASAGCETELYFDALLHEEGTLEDLLLSDTTFLNPRLAEHYGIQSDDVDALAAPSDGHKDAIYARVSLAGSERRGLLTQTSFLAATSNPNRTSPVKRGKWVLDQLLCSPPPAPPPNVEGLIDENASAATLREQLELHRANPACAGCHALMDPIGLGLENFDADGQYRTEDNGFAIDASSMLFSQTPFDGPVELAQVLSEREELARCAAQQTLIYGTGLTMPERLTFDACTIDATREAFLLRGGRLRDVFVVVAQSAAFKMRRADPELDLAATQLQEEEP